MRCIDGLRCLDHQELFTVVWHNRGIKALAHTHMNTAQNTLVLGWLTVFCLTMLYLGYFSLSKLAIIQFPLASKERTKKSESEHHAPTKLTSVALRLCSPSVKCVGIHMNSVPVSRMLILCDVTRLPPRCGLRPVSRVSSPPRGKGCCLMTHTEFSEYLTLQIM